jgi:DNA-directed RNA polymerase subunit H (RpoH/RPB5)
MEEKKKEVLSEEQQRELLKQLRERIKQLRMIEYIDDDEEPEIFLDVS